MHRKFFKLKLEDYYTVEVPNRDCSAVHKTTTIPGKTLLFKFLSEEYILGYDRVLISGDLDNKIPLFIADNEQLFRQLFVLWIEEQINE